jgi:cytochrome c biogenesis protein CcdA
MIVVSQDENVQCNTVNCAWLSCDTQTLATVSPVVQNILNSTTSVKNDDVSPINAQDKPTWLSKNSSKWWFFAIMLPAAISDSINPCAFAVMLLLLTTILTRHKSRKKTLLAWGLFALAVFLTYFAMGVGLFSALATSNNTFILKLIVGILWLLVWLANLKDYFRYGKWFVMEVPLSRRPKMMALIENVSSPWWTFFVGALVSLFLLPCSSGPYFTILWFMSSQTKDLNLRWYIYLIIYNLIFVLPMMAIAVMVAFWYASVDKIAKIKHEKTKLIHLVVWLLMLGLWVYVLTTL